MNLRLSPWATPTVVDSDSRLISRKITGSDSIIQGKGYPEVIVRLIVGVLSVVLSPIFRLVTELSLVKWGIVGFNSAGCF
jgi:hypothetical protein